MSWTSIVLCTIYAGWLVLVNSLVRLWRLTLGYAFTMKSDISQQCGNRFENLLLVFFFWGYAALGKAFQSCDWCGLLCAGSPLSLWPTPWYLPNFYAYARSFSSQSLSIYFFGQRANLGLRGNKSYLPRINAKWSSVPLIIRFLEWK